MTPLKNGTLPWSVTRTGHPAALTRGAAKGTAVVTARRARGRAGGLGEMDLHTEPHTP